MRSDYDVLVIGGGMAGAAVASHLAETLSVCILEMESHPGYHSTGRSAAVFSDTYGNAAVRALTKASRSFLFSPPADFCSAPLVHPRPVLMAVQDTQIAARDHFLSTLAQGDSCEALSAEDALRACPALRPDHLVGGILCEDTADIEVHELHQGYLRRFKARGGSLVTDVPVASIERKDENWSLITRKGDVLTAQIVINAAGAWADQVGMLAGACEIGLKPYRRTALLVDPPPGMDISKWPMVIDAEEQFYFKPDAGLVLVSPADETPCEPSDAQPDELDVAIAIDRLQTATIFDVRRVKQRWAGLRSFVADRSPVVGYDPKQPGFFWLAALGGYGIQTAPALSEVAARLVLKRPIGQELASFGIDPAALSPDRM